jgi:hypothetical protein
MMLKVLAHQRGITPRTLSNSAHNKFLKLDVSLLT